MDDSNQSPPDVSPPDDGRGEPQSQALCHHCARPVPPLVDFCPACGCPLSVMSTAGPYEQVLANGFMYREGSRQPKRIVLVGMWLILGPLLLANTFFIWVVIHDLRKDIFTEHSRNASERVFDLVSLALAGAIWWLQALILRRTTANYFEYRKLATEESDDAARDEDGSESATTDNQV